MLQWVTKALERKGDNLISPYKVALGEWCKRGEEGETENPRNPTKKRAKGSGRKGKSGAA